MKETAAVLIDGPRRPAVTLAATGERALSNPPKKTAVIPSLGGSICNDLFNITLGLPSIWIPHSYSACSQHAPNEHLLLSQAREALAIMAGLYWDLGEPGTPGESVGSND